MEIRSKALRESARGEACTLQIVGICNHDRTTTVLAHLPSDSHGMAKKSDDISAAYSCSSCHDAVDRRRQACWNEDDVCEFENHREWYMRRAMYRTIKRAIELGIITIRS